MLSLKEFELKPLHGNLTAPPKTLDLMASIHTNAAPMPDEEPEDQ
jgi:hypothetical protein